LTMSATRQVFMLPSAPLATRQYPQSQAAGVNPCRTICRIPGHRLRPEVARTLTPMQSGPQPQNPLIARGHHAHSTKLSSLGSQAPVQSGSAVSTRPSPPLSAQSRGIRFHGPIGTAFERSIDRGLGAGILAGLRLRRRVVDGVGARPRPVLICERPMASGAQRRNHAASLGTARPATVMQRPAWSKGGETC